MSSSEDKRREGTAREEEPPPQSTPKARLGGTTTATSITNTTNDYGIIPSLVAQFLDMETLFESLSLVNKSTYLECNRLLKRRCEKNHPVLLLGDAPPTLTYGAWRRFLRPEKPGLFPSCEDGENIPRDDEYDILLEIYCKDKLVSYGVEDLPEGFRHKRVDSSNPINGLLLSKFLLPKADISFPIPHFSIRNVNMELRDCDDTGWGPHIRVRLVVRSKSTGAMATLMDNDRSKGVIYSHSKPEYHLSYSKTITRNLKLVTNVAFAQVEGTRKADAREEAANRSILPTYTYRIADPCPAFGWTSNIHPAFGHGGLKSPEGKAQVIVTFGYRGRLGLAYEIEDLHERERIFQGLVLEEIYGMLA